MIRLLMMALMALSLTGCLLTIDSDGRILNSEWDEEIKSALHNEFLRQLNAGEASIRKSLPKVAEEDEAAKGSSL